MKAVAALLLLLSYLSNCHGWTCTAPPQQPSAAQIDAGQGQVVMTDSSLNVFFLTGSAWSKLGSVAFKHVSVGPAGIWGVDSSNKIYKFVDGEFIPISGLDLQQVDAGGSGQIVGVTSSNTIHCLQSNAASAYQHLDFVSWRYFDGQLKYFSCGPKGCWGVNSADNIYVTKITPISCDKTGWTQVQGSAKMVEVGTDGSVFVVNAGGSVYQRLGITDDAPQGTDWVQIPFSLPVKHVSYDLGRLWVVMEIGLILECQQ
nr:fish-egg lectin [Nothobranchius furzeri]